MKKIDPIIYEIGHILSRQDISGEYWMTNLSPLLRQLPVMYLCIPGTIKSYSYSSSLSIVEKHQNSNITNQLLNGIRYLNIDVYWDDLQKKWMCDTHVNLQDILRQINIFAMMHSNEVIFLYVKTNETDAESVNHISLIINHLSHLLFERKESEIPRLWYSLYSLNQICLSGKNIILINDQFSYHHCVFPSFIKYIRTGDKNVLTQYLPISPISICTSFKLPEFLLKIDWLVEKPYKNCCQYYFSTNTIAKQSENISNSHETLIEYINSPFTSIDNINKIFILCVEFESSIDLLFLCMQIMDKRFYT